VRATPDRPQAAGAIPTPLILFDGVCNLCSWSVQFLAPRDRDGMLRFAAVQSAVGQSVLKQHGLPTDDYESFVLVEDGRAYFKSAAFFRTLRYMRWPWRLLGIGRVLPRRLADWLYDRVARNRYTVFGRKAVCMLPRPDLAARFLK
jgi:predicted DCC family thiol-disulfide oxidoreductase YuxK